MGLKQIFDGLYVDQLIQRNERGEIIVYPRGMFGRGYLLPPEREQEYRGRLRTTMAASLLIGFALALLLLRAVQAESPLTPLGWVLVLALAALALAGIVHYQRRLAKGLQPTDDPQVSGGEWFRRGRRARPVWTYWTSAVGGVLLALLAATGVAIGISDGDNLVGSSIFLAAIGAISVWDGVMGLKERRTAR